MPQPYDLSSQELIEKGPLIKILIGPSDLFNQMCTAKGDPLIKPQFAIAMIDTGIENIGISPSLAATLRFPSTDVLLVYSAGDPVPSVRRGFDVSIRFSHGPMLSNEAAVECDIISSIAHVALGRSVLHRAKLEYDGAIDSVILTFP